jgi:hypothetical protein
MVFKQRKSKKWWYKFNWNGEQIRESTKQTNRRVAEQMEAAHKTALAMGEVGIREKKLIPTLREFAQGDFRGYVSSTFAAKVQTRRYYEHGIKVFCSYARLADERLDAIRLVHSLHQLGTNDLCRVPVSSRTSPSASWARCRTAC